MAVGASGCDRIFSFSAKPGEVLCGGGCRTLSVCKAKVYCLVVKAGGTALSLPKVPVGTEIGVPGWAD